MGQGETPVKTVWAVETGEYSAYRVVGLFSSEENAQLMADKMNEKVGRRYGEVATVNEWPIDPAIGELNQGRSRWFVRMGKDGVVQNHGQDVDMYSLEEDFVVDVNYGGAFVAAHVWATDAKHAIKMVNEKRIQALALGTWGKK